MTTLQITSLSSQLRALQIPEDFSEQQKRQINILIRDVETRAGTDHALRPEEEIGSIQEAIQNIRDARSAVNELSNDRRFTALTEESRRVFNNNIESLNRITSPENERITIVRDRALRLLEVDRRIAELSANEEFQRLRAEFLENPDDRALYQQILDLPIRERADLFGAESQSALSQRVEQRMDTSITRHPHFEIMKRGIEAAIVADSSVGPNTPQVIKHGRAHPKKRKFTIVDRNLFIYTPNFPLPGSGHTISARLGFQIKKTNEVWHATAVAVLKPKNPRKNRWDSGSYHFGEFYDRYRLLTTFQQGPNKHYFERPPILFFRANDKAGLDGRVHQRRFMIARLHILGDAQHITFVNRPDAAKDLLNLCLEGATALDALHRQHQRVHRDVAPANFLIDKREGDVLGMRLSDLTDSRGVNEENYRFKYHPGCLAPEIQHEIDQRRGRGQQTPAGDMYAFGKTVEHLLARVLQAHPDFNRTHPELFQDIIQLYTDLKKENPEERPTAAQTIERLHEINLSRRAQEAQ